MHDQGLGRTESTTSPCLLCPQCENGTLRNRPCERFCERCGYVESCEDNFLPMQMNPKDETVPS